MLRKTLLLSFFFLFVLQIRAQIIVDSVVGSFLSNYPQVEIVPVERDTSYWKSKITASFLFSENYYKDWNAGGNNVVTGIWRVDWFAVYNKGNLKWDHILNAVYGLNYEEESFVKKTNDLIEYTSNLGYRVFEKWYATTQLRFNTQFTNGYEYRSDGAHVLKTAFFSPAKMFIGAGVKYTEGNSLYVYFSPFTENTTWVLNSELAAEGGINRNGEKVYNKIGSWIDFFWKYKFYREFTVQNKLSVYFDYINDLGRIDYFDWQLDIVLPVYKFLTVSFGTHTKYEKDVLFDVEGSDSGEKERRVQFRQILGIGLKYEF